MQAKNAITATVTTPNAKTGAVTPPPFLPPNFGGMPDELKQMKNWVVWRYLPPKSSGGKWRKVPFQPNGMPASTTDRTTWSQFDECCDAYAKGKWSGVGFVFDGEPDENGLVYAGVDFDSQAFEGERSIHAAEWVDSLESYVETSVSGVGRHIILKARPLASGISHEGIELYTSGRYFTMTGCTDDVVRPVISAPSVFDALAKDLQAKLRSFGVGNSKPPMPTSNVVTFKLPEWVMKTRPAAAFAHLPVESLADGLEPNIAEIRSAVDAIPAAAIATEPEWMKLARALAHEAAVFNTLKEPIWEILDGISQRAPGYNKDDNRLRFERYIREALNRADPITVATVFRMASSHGWQGWSPPIAAASSTTKAPVTTPSRAVLVSQLPLVPPKRQWLHGTDLIRGAVMLLAAPGGRAKSTWLLTCALACASGRELLGAHVFGGPLRVLCLSTEDGLPEMALRLRAAMKHHGLTDADVPGLFVIGADGQGLPLLRGEGNRAVMDQRGVGALEAELHHTNPDVLIIDPLINTMGGVTANENAAAALLMGYLAGLAASRRMAVALAHHASKGRDPASAESAMGAASFVNLARVALAIEPLEEKKAGDIGVPPWEAKFIFRIVGTKQNFAPPSTKDRWFRMVSFEMPNAQPPIYMNGDAVAVVEPFQPGSSVSAFPIQLVGAALRVIASANPPLSPSKNSPGRYAAPVIANAITPYRGGQASEMDGKGLLDHLMKTGLVGVNDVKISRLGKGTDTRKGLVLTADGMNAAQQASQTPPPYPTPQSPQSPAVVLRDDAGGEPPGSPATPGGCGGNTGGASIAGDVPQEDVS